MSQIRIAHQDDRNPEQPDQPAQLIDISRIETDRLDPNWRPRDQFISRTILHSAQQAQRDEEERCTIAELTALLQAYIPAPQIPHVVEDEQGHVLYDLEVQSYVAQGFSGYTRTTAHVSTTGAWVFREDTSDRRRSTADGKTETTRFFLTSEQIKALFWAQLDTWRRAQNGSANDKKR